jgi:hypothetical protein
MTRTLRSAGCETWWREPLLRFLVRLEGCVRCDRDQRQPSVSQVATSSRSGLSSKIWPNRNDAGLSDRSSSIQRLAELTRRRVFLQLMRSSRRELLRSASFEPISVQHTARREARSRFIGGSRVWPSSSTSRPVHRLPQALGDDRKNVGVPAQFAMAAIYRCPPSAPASRRGCMPARRPGRRFG